VISLLEIEKLNEDSKWLFTIDGVYPTLNEPIHVSFSLSHDPTKLGHDPTKLGSPGERIVSHLWLGGNSLAHNELVKGN
jgi:hypothetical protein